MGTKKGRYCSDAEDHEMKMVVSTSVKQGKSMADIDWTPDQVDRYPHSGLAKKLPKK